MNRSLAFVLVAFINLFFPRLEAAAQKDKVTLSGYVTDAKSEESLIGVQIRNENDKSGTVTNNYGFYSLRVDKGELHLKVSYVGYLPVDTVVMVSEKDQKLNIQLQEAGELLGEVVVVAKPQTEFHGMETGRIKLSMDNVRSMPTFFGEADVIKYAQLMPGVARGTEGISGMIVRGGNLDENLYLVDGNPMYNINHLFGLFSTFNPDAIKTANLYKGSFPARFGGRLSSVLDVRMKDGDMEKFSGTASIGLISSRLHLEGPLVKGKSSYSVSMRRTYLDLLTKPLFAWRNKQAEKDAELGSATKLNPGYYFYDVNMKVNHKFDNKNRLFLTLYMGNDVLNIKSQDMDHIYENVHHPDGSVEHKKHNDLTLSEDMRAKMIWGSKLASLGWNHVFNSSLFAHTTLYYGGYSAFVESDDKSYQSIKNGQRELDYEFSYKLTSKIDDFGLRTDFDYRPLNNHFVRFGGNLIRHIFRPNVEDIYTYSIYESDQKDEQIEKKPQEPIHATEFSLYAEDEMEWTDRFSTNLGAHTSLLWVEGKKYFSFQPRLSTRFLLHPHLSVKASYAHMSQYVHLLQNTLISLPTDIWVPATAKIRPMESSQYALGLYYENREWEASMEGYYKDLRNLIAYQDGSAIYITGGDWQDRVAQGNGRAYGVEWLLKRNEGRLTGWLAYTLSWADRIFPNGEVNQGRRYRDKYDNRHKLNIVLQYKIHKNLDCAAVWTFSNGNRMSVEQEKYIDINNEVSGFFDERNNFQMPNYHRLDLSLNWYRPKKNGNMGIWNFSIYNAYLHHNSFYVVNSWKGYDLPNGDRAHADTVESVSIFPILPSVSYTFKF